MLADPKKRDRVCVSYPPRSHHPPQASRPHCRGQSGVLLLLCNVYKGPNLSGLDPASGMLTRLYPPRRHKWAYHFRFEGSTLVGRTAIGRTTIQVLHMNHPQMIGLRDILIAGGVL